MHRSTIETSAALLGGKPSGQRNISSSIWLSSQRVVNSCRGCASVCGMRCGAQLMAMRAQISQRLVTFRVVPAGSAT